jgi:hypothetical protein
MGHKGSALSAVNDENTLIFTNNQKEDFIKAKQLIDELMSNIDKSENKSNQQISIADELKKFSELKDQGIISEDEFNNKKKELLK